MTLLILGLALFLGTHSIRIIADGWRSAQIARIGPHAWKLGYTVVSLTGFLLLLWGYGIARQAPLELWSPPTAMRHIAGLLTLVAFVLLAAAYVPKNGIKAKLHHPMVLSVKVWAAAHLLANGTLADLLLFGSFLIWAVLSFRVARRRDRVGSVSYPAATLSGTLATIVAGGVAWMLFAFWLHSWLFGVHPFY